MQTIEDKMHALNLNVNEVRRQTEDDFLKVNLKVNRLIDHYLAMHQDHYANHEQVKKEMQLIVQGLDDTADHDERIENLESGTSEKFNAAAKDIERIFAILQEHKIHSQICAPEPSDSPLQSVYVVMDLESRQSHAHRVFANIDDARVYCCTQVANYSLVEMPVIGTPHNLVP